MNKTKKFLDARSLSTQAQGQWLGIFSFVCPGLFDEAINNLGRHVRCPIHGGDSDFRFIDVSTSGRPTSAQSGVAMCSCQVFKDGFELLSKATGLSFRNVLEQVDIYLNGDSKEVVTIRKSTPIAPPVKAISEEELEKLKNDQLNRLRSIWNVAVPITPDYASAYLKARGIDASTLEGVMSLRSLKQLGYYEKASNYSKEVAYKEGGVIKVGSFPAMLGLLRDVNGDPVAIHRSWLSEDGRSKAPVSMPRKITRSLSAAGAAIRLFPAENCETLGIVEGIETALAVRELATKGQWEDVSTIPVWACFSEGNIRNFQIPTNLLDTLKRIIVFADNDERGTGSNAGHVFKERIKEQYPHIEVIVRAPEVMGWDWLDFLVNSK